MTDVQIRREKSGHWDTHSEGRWLCEEGARKPSNAAISEGMSRAGGNYQKLEEQGNILH